MTPLHSRAASPFDPELGAGAVTQAQPRILSITPTYPPDACPNARHSPCPQGPMEANPSSQKSLRRLGMRW